MLLEEGERGAIKVSLDNTARDLENKNVWRLAGMSAEKNFLYLS
jgi:hypothetical protein